MWSVPNPSSSLSTSLYEKKTTRDGRQRSIPESVIIEIPPVFEVEPSFHSHFWPTGGFTAFTTCITGYPNSWTSGFAGWSSPITNLYKEREIAWVVSQYEKSSPLCGSAENWARMNYFRAKPEFIISNYIIARETAQPAVFQLCIPLWALRIVYYSSTYTFMLSCNKVWKNGWSAPHSLHCSFNSR